MDKIMASLRVLPGSSVFPSSACSYSSRRKGTTIKATINVPKMWLSPVSLPSFSKRAIVQELTRRGHPVPMEKDFNLKGNRSPSPRSKTGTCPDFYVVAKLYTVMEAVADRVEMHKNIGDQRDNWNRLLLTSINTMTLTASTMTGLASISPNAASMSALKVSSVILYVAATGMLSIMNKIQPSQLAEEQRNASRLFKQIHEELNTLLAIGNPSPRDVDEAMEKVLALDRAYPLPLLGAMLDKFPSTVEPAVWWPLKQQGFNNSVPSQEMVNKGFNGWNSKLEERMGEFAKILRKKDKEEYLRLSGKALRLDKVLAISGPLLTALAAVGSAFVGSKFNAVAVMVGVGGGALASIVNCLELGGQAGMVFEMYRSNAGFFKLMEGSIELNLKERKLVKRDNGELLEMKVALQLGRSLSELRGLAANSSSSSPSEFEEFKSKLF